MPERRYRLRVDASGLIGFGRVRFKQSASPPPPPDAAATAQAQGQANTSTAAAQTALNLVNQRTPYGSTTYTPTETYTTPEGQTVPRYTQDVALSPLGQSLLTGQQNVANQLIPTAETIAGQIGGPATTPLNFDTPYAASMARGQGGIGSVDPRYQSELYGAPAALKSLDPAYADMLSKSPELLNQNVTDAIYRQQKSFLDPQWDDQAKDLENQLSRQGIPVGSEAYNSALQQLSNSRTQAYQSAQDSAIGKGTEAAGNLFGLALAGQGASQGREQAAFDASLTGSQADTNRMLAQFGSGLQGQQQSLAEQQLSQNNGIGLLQSIFGASPSTPTQPIATTSPSSVAPIDVTGATALQNKAAMDAYQSQVASNNATTGGVASALGTAATAAAVIY